MKILIAFYSRTGNTKKLAQRIEKIFRKKGHEVDIEEIKPKKEHSFWGWFFLRIFKKDCEIEEPKIKNLSMYDVVCIGSPNWTGPSLPIVSYLKRVSGLSYKKIGIFSTSFLPGFIEFYLFSGYLFLYGLGRLLRQKQARIFSFLMLSSFFSCFSCDSSYGKKRIENFCQKLEEPIYSLKEYFLKQKEAENFQTAIMIFSSFLLFFLFLELGLLIFHSDILPFSRFLLFFGIGIVLWFLMITVFHLEMGIWGRFLMIILSVFAWTLTVLIIWTLVSSIWNPVLGRVIIFGYVLLFLATTFLRDIKTIAFASILIFLCYFLLTLNPIRDIFFPKFDIPFLILFAIIVGAISQSLQKYLIGLLEAQEELETTRAVLEIKVRARTQELEERARLLDLEVKKRTEELQQKIKELERFNRLAIGRELRMIQLKKEIKKLKEELQKCQQNLKMYKKAEKD